MNKVGSTNVADFFIIGDIFGLFKRKILRVVCIDCIRFIHDRLLSKNAFISLMLGWDDVTSDAIRL